MRWLGYAWDAAAWVLILSVVAAPLVAVIKKARARGRRKFRDEPLARVRQLHQYTASDHFTDAS